MGRLIRSRPALLALAAVVAVIVGGFGVWTSASEQTATTTAQQQAGSLDRLCQSVPGAAAEAGTDCARAAAIVRDGVDGALGPPGRGVLRTDVTPAGRLVVAYSDGEVVDVGPVVGAPGTPGMNGADGPAGRGIATTTVDTGRLLVTFTDGEVRDLGQVVGSDGRGVADLDGSTGRLMVTLTDGTVLDAGPLPPGPPGVPGERGPEGEAAPSVEFQEFRFPDGTVVRCPRAGGPDNAPVFDCDRSAPPAPEPEPAPTGTLPTTPGG